MSSQQCYAALASALQSASQGLPIAWGGAEYSPQAGQPWLQLWSLPVDMVGSGDADKVTSLAQIDIMCPVSFGDAKILAYADGILSVMRERAAFEAGGQQIWIARRSQSAIMRDGQWRKVALTIKYMAAVSRV